MPPPAFEIKFEHSPELSTYAGGYPIIFLSCCGQSQGQEQRLDALTKGAISRARVQSVRFKGRMGQFLDVSGFPLFGQLGRIVLLGTEKSKASNGEESQGSAEQEKALLSDIFMQGARVFSRLHGIGSASGLWVYDGVRVGDFFSRPAFVCEGVLGASLSSYRFEDYLTEDENDERAIRLKRLGICVSGAQYKSEALASAWVSCSALVSGVFLARDLVNEPPNALDPVSYAQRLRRLSSAGDGIRVEVLEEKQLAKLGFRALLAVARASEHAARVVILHYRPRKSDKQSAKGSSNCGPLVFVGKGVTFDSGGLSLKPAHSMEDMKMDMGGSAAVVGALKAISQRRSARECVGIVGLVENMPGGNAQRPGDVVRTLSGKTVEVLNTDAEGRLVLADLLWYAQTRFNPSAVIDLATLTGAMIVALGEEYAGFFSNDDSLARSLELSSKSSSEKLWRLPLDKAYDSLLESPIADMKNIGGGGAGSITAAQFLQRFIKGSKKGEKRTSWAHIDIAGVTWATKSRLGRPRGASGFGVRLLCDLADRLSNEE